MSATTRVNGSQTYDASGTLIGNYKQGNLYSVLQLKAFLITAPGSLAAQDGDAAGEIDQAMEAIIREVQPLMYYSTGTDGTITVVVDGHAVDAATLQARIQALGTVNSLNLATTTVALATALVAS